MFNVYQKALLARKNKVILSEGECKGISQDDLMAFNAELASLGYTLSGDVVEVLQTLSLDKANLFRLELINELKSILGADVKYTPLFVEFPYDNVDRGAYFVSRIIGAIQNEYSLTDETFKVLECGHAIDTNLFDLDKFSACPICQHKTKDFSAVESTLELPPIERITPFKIITLGTEDDARDIFTNLVGSKSSISEKDVEFITEVVKTEGDNVKLILPNEIPMKEQLSLIVALLMQHTNIVGEVSKFVKTATDVIRLAAQLSGEDNAKISSRVSFKLKNKERKLVLSLLNKIKYPLEDMKRNRNAFLRLGKYLHIGTMADKYPNAFKAMDVLRNDPDSIITFNSKIESAVCNVLGVVQTPKGTIAPQPEPRKSRKEIFYKNNQIPVSIMSMGYTEEDIAKLKSIVKKTEPKEECSKSKPVQEKRTVTKNEQKVSVAEALELLKTRAGEFARRMDFFLRNTDEQDKVLSIFEEIADTLTTKMLLQLNAHFDKRSEKAELRYYMPKGKVSSLIVEKEDKRKTISSDVVYQVKDIIFNVLKERFSKLESLGNVYIDSSLNKLLIPFEQRNASDALVTYARGSRIPVESKCGMLRFYQYWDHHCDLDLSITFFNDEWKQIESASYYNEEGSFFRHSGDIQDGSGGAAECVDVDIEKAKNAGVRYALMFVNSFSGESFVEINALAGVMERVDDKTGELFDASTIKQKMMLANESKAIVPFFFDFELMEMIWVDMNLKARAFDNANSKAGVNAGIGAVLEDYVNTKANLFTLANLHAQARAESVDYEFNTEKEYDLIIDASFASQTDEILSKWIL